MITKFNAVKNLVNGGFSADNVDDITTYKFLEGQTAPTQQAVDAEYKRLLILENRQIAYPPFTDFLDAYAKGDQVALDKYKADCMAVKAKYPKV